MRFIPGLLLFSTIALTAACGGESSIEGARNKPNSFASVKNPANDFSPGSTGDSNNTGDLDPGEVRVTMELPGGLAPDGEPTRRNLRIVQPDSVAVYQIDSNLTNVGSVGYSTRKDDEGYTIIKFDNGQPLSPDIVIEARYGNTTLRSLAADDDRDIKINPFSEYLLRNTLSSYTPGEFQQLLDCADSASDTLCLNKLVWPALADQVHDFEINIPTGASIAGALDFLSKRADFVSYLDSAANYPLLDDQSVSDVLASSGDYNSIFLGMELGQTFLESSLAGSGQWGLRSGREEPTSPTTYRYPGSTLTSLDFIGIKITSLAAQIPYDRKTLIHQQGNEFYTRGSEIWDLNTHSSSPGAATIDSDTRLLAIRALYQSITGRGSARTIGWTRNPYYMDAYIGEAIDENTGPDRTLAGYFSAGKAIELKSEKGKLARKDELEAHYVSALELNLLREEGFDASIVNNRDYNMIYFATRFSQGPGAASPMQVEMGSGSWAISAGSDGSTITQNQNYSTLSRDSSGGLDPVGTGTRSDNWTLSSRIARLSNGDKHIGRLNLFVNNPAGPFAQPDLGVGASVPDGSLMAFNLVNAAPSGGAIIGDGLLIAAEDFSSAKPTSGSYRVQGFIVGLEYGFNKLIHLDNGALILSGSTASLSSKTFEVLHSVDDETVSSPEEGQLTTPLLTDTAGNNGQVDFNAGDLSLTGFVTADHSQFFLLYQDKVNGESRRGLLLATKMP